MKRIINVGKLGNMVPPIGNDTDNVMRNLYNALSRHFVEVQKPTLSITNDMPECGGGESSHARPRGRGDKTCESRDCDVCQRRPFPMLVGTSLGTGERLSRRTAVKIAPL